MHNPNPNVEITLCQERIVRQVVIHTDDGVIDVGDQWLLLDWYDAIDTEVCIEYDYIMVSHTRDLPQSQDRYI